MRDLPLADRTVLVRGMMPPHAVGGALYAEWEAVIAAVIYGVEAAAYVSLALCVFVLVMRGGLRALRAVNKW